MSNRYIPTETKVQAMEECLQLVNVEDTANRYGVHPHSIYYWFDKIKANLNEVVANETPGPKPKPQPTQEEPKTDSKERPTKCDRCGNTRIWKNGTYQVIVTTHPCSGWICNPAVRPPDCKSGGSERDPFGSPNPQMLSIVTCAGGAAE